MATPTYDLLDSTTLSSSASSVSFTSIDQSYRDLVVVFALPVGDSFSALLKINNDTGSNYSYVTAEGRAYSSSTNSSSGTLSFGVVQNSSYATTTSPNLTSVQLMDYSATDKHKAWLSRSNAPVGRSVEMIAGRWANTSAITSLEIYTNGTFSVGGTFYLYGIAS